MATGLPDRDSVSKRKYWREFLAIYQRSPELWDVRHSGYRHKDSKNEAYDLLEAKLKEIDPHATRCDVQRRINIFRTNYRRERLRIIKQKEAGLHADMCKPTLWYYDLMDFLLTQESFLHGTRIRRSKIKGLPSNRALQTQKFENAIDWATVKCYEPESTALKIDETSLLSPKIEIFEDVEQLEAETSNEIKVNTSNTSAIVCNEPTSNELTCNEPISTTSTVIRGSSAPVLSEASEVLAKSWAIQYEEMEPTQRILARKAIADILFEGCMGNLRVNRGECTTVSNHH